MNVEFLLILFISLIVALTILNVIPIFKGFTKHAEAENVIRIYLREYKAKLTGGNRFLVSEEILQEMFPEYSKEVVRKVWIRLVDSKVIDQDQMDGAWCIK